MSEKRITVLIADDHRLFRAGIISLLEHIHNIIVLDECADGEELMEKYFELRPDMILTDVSMPSVSGFEAFKEIKKLDPKVKTIFITMYDSEDYVFYAHKIGAKGLLSKNIRKDELIFAINTVSNGNKYFGEKWSDEKLTELDKKYNKLSEAEIEPEIVLSNRDKEILLLISEGNTSNQIACKLNLSKRTVDNHRRKLMKRIKVSSLTELIVYAIKFAFATKVKEDPD